MLRLEGIGNHLHGSATCTDDPLDTRSIDELDPTVGDQGATSGVLAVDDDEIYHPMERSYSQGSLESSRSNDDSLPPYERVSLVRENQPNIQLTIQQAAGSLLEVAACDIDSIEQLKLRVCRLTSGGLQSSNIELTRKSYNVVLHNSGQSLAQLGIKDGTALDLYTRESDGTFMSPAGIRHDVVRGQMVLTGKKDEFQTHTGHDAVEIGAGAGASKRTRGGKGRLRASSPSDGALMAGDVDSSGTCVSGDDDGSSSDDGEDEAPPPEYSMIDRVRVLPGDELTKAEQAMRFVVIGCVLAFVVGVFLVLPVALVAVGATNIGRCPSRPSLPIWMVVFGAAYLVQSIIERFGVRAKSQIEMNLRRSPMYQVMPASSLRTAIDAEYAKRYHRLDQLDQLMQTFGFIWFVIGSVWVFGCTSCRSEYDEFEDTGCDQTAYRFALVVIIVLYVLLAMPFLAILLYIVAVAFTRSQHHQQQ
eukprot:m.299490 g.299490  ORF g.299490 m.299490 type:complete len:474 (-) comp20114_c0_seq2:229-1650(-)